tara:strand:- start:5499 stop:6011 length:513 start_codon:yes stop_codon:yes gene_type:complete
MALTKLNAAALPAGSVIQTISSEFNTPSSFSSTTTSNTSTDVMSATITPKFSSSKILVKVKVTAGAAGVNYEFSCGVKRGSTRIGGNTDPTDLFLGNNIGASGHPAGEGPTTVYFETLDSPATTSATTYTSYIYGGESSTYYINRGNSTNNTRLWANSGNCTITLMEIKV